MGYAKTVEGNLVETRTRDELGKPLKLGSNASTPTSNVACPSVQDTLVGCGWYRYRYRYGYMLPVGCWNFKE